MRANKLPRRVRLNPPSALLKRAYKPPRKRRGNLEACFEPQPKPDAGLNSSRASGQTNPGPPPAMHTPRAAAPRASASVVFGKRLPSWDPTRTWTWRCKINPVIGSEVSREQHGPDSTQRDASACAARGEGEDGHD